MKTQEYIPGQGYVTVDADFRAYDNPYDSTADWYRLMQNKRYAGVLNAPDLPAALTAIGSSGYATDPAYSKKLSSIMPSTPEQHAFFEARKAEARRAGADEVRAELAARQAALESAWGRSAPGGNYYGIKGPKSQRSMIERTYATEPVVPFQPEPEQTAMQMPPYMPPQEEPQRERGMMQQLGTDPFWQMGLGILSAPGYGGNWLRSVATGMQAGQQMLNQQVAAEDELYALQQKRKQEMLQRSTLKRAADQLRAQGKTVEADMLESQMLDKGAVGKLLGIDPASYGKNPQIVDMGNGQYAYALVSDTGEVKYQPIQGTPWSVAGQSPEMLQQREAAKTMGKQAMEEQMAGLAALTKGGRQATTVIETIDELLSPDQKDAREWATGASGRWGGGAMPFTGAADWKARLQNLQSNLFMQAFEMLKGGGQITEREGQAAREALSNINLDTMTEEAVVKELERVKRHMRNMVSDLTQRAAQGDERARKALMGELAPGGGGSAAMQPGAPQAPAVGPTGAPGGEVPAGVDPAQWQRLQQLRQQQSGGF